MSAAKARRGRPKGSGIDDQVRLVEIAKMIETDPQMKPTTAIKAIGISDPSAIRRLRDKFNMQHDMPVQAVRATAPTVSAAANSNHRAAPLKLADPVRRAAPNDQARSKQGGQATGAEHTATHATERPVRPQPMPIAAMLFGLGLNAATAMFEQQMMLAQSVMRLPPVRDLLRHQIAFTEFMLTVANHSPGSRYAH